MTASAKAAKRQVTVAVACDTTLLYDTLPIAIAYLQRVQAEHAPHVLYLDENWTGYENMEMRFVYCREETDEEFDARIALEAAQALYEQEKTKREAQREADEKQYRALAVKLGRHVY